MNIQIKIKNLPEFIAALSSSPRVIGRHLNTAIQQSALYFLGKTKQNIKNSTDMWKSPIKTGYMWNHIFPTVSPLRAEITATADYAIYVHEGTRHMQKRPFFDITANHEERAIGRIFETELANALEEVSHV